MAARAEIHRAERLFNALGDPTRRAIVGDLCKRESTVSQLADTLGITLTAVGQHLAVLEACGLVRTEKVGRVRTCRFESKGLTVLQSWITHHRTVWEQNLDRLGDVLADEDDA